MKIFLVEIGIEYCGPTEYTAYKDKNDAMKFLERCGYELEDPHKVDYIAHMTYMYYIKPGEAEEDIKHWATIRELMVY